MNDNLKKIAQFALAALRSAGIDLCSYKVVDDKVSIQQAGKVIAEFLIDDGRYGFICYCTSGSKQTSMSEKNSPSKLVKRMAIWHVQRKLADKMKPETKAFNASLKELSNA